MSVNLHESLEYQERRATRESAEVSTQEVRVLINELQALKGDLIEALGELRRMKSPTMSLAEVAAVLKKSEKRVRNIMSSDPGHWLHGCVVRGESGLFLTGRVMEELGALSVLDWHIDG